MVEVVLVARVRMRARLSQAEPGSARAVVAERVLPFSGAVQVEPELRHFFSFWEHDALDVLVLIS